MVSHDDVGAIIVAIDLGHGGGGRGGNIGCGSGCSGGCRCCSGRSPDVVVAVEEVAADWVGGGARGCARGWCAR